MKLIIDVSDKDYEKLKDGHIPFSILDVMQNGTPIPDNATNGDVIKAMFPNGKYSEYFADVEMKMEENDTRFKSVFDRDWWEELYQKGGKE